jgi:Zn-dependent peptidase ImmA (M78 family)
MGDVIVRVDVQSKLLVWARQRSGADFNALAQRFPKLGEWEGGEIAPTLKQLEKFAQATHTPVGFFFLSEPPTEILPIPDFRTFADEPIARPSPDLLDTVYQCEQRQEWFREYAQVNRLDPVPFVSSSTLSTPAEEAATAMREALEFPAGQRGSSWSEAFRRLVERAEEAGVLVMVNGVVGSNTHRKLNPEEFRGFALVDPLAPVVFVNGADTRAAQIFTLAHELAHIWLGQTGLDDIDLKSRATSGVERWCNAVAAEFLVPLEQIHARYMQDNDLTEEIERLAQEFRVSTLVVLRRIHEAGHLTWNEYRQAYQNELARLLPMLEAARGGGGNFYNTQPSRVSKLFARTVIASALEGQTLFTDAFQMLGFKKQSTFDELAQRLGII